MNKNKFYGITLNDKIPKLDKVNSYKSKIKIKFEGQAFIIERNKKDEIIKNKIENNHELTKEGNYEIEFINNKDEIYSIKANIKDSCMILIFLILIIFFIILFLILKPGAEKNNYSDRIFDFINLSILKFDNNNASKSSQYDFTLKNVKKAEKNTTKDVIISQEINIEDTICIENNLKGKLAPGTEGKFSIIINSKNNNSDMKYTINFIDLCKEKPTNMFFKIKGNNEIYLTLQDLEKDLIGIIKKNSRKVIIIEWQWPYESGNEDKAISQNDKKDTDNGINFKDYKFQIYVKGEDVN